MAVTATSSMVVDLSCDNDNAATLAAAASIPTVSADTPFERSCDNPECSAPKLISLVPKQETPEFITEPVIMNQPTLINGFTTVFQIDGIGARMNDIMYGDGNSDLSTSNNVNGPAKPKSVFRIVPNTHAHIVNYVVVDGAGETMRKIKSNDADTMRKLLDSQRLSAEQMLKKLIGKAFKTAVRQPESQIPQTNINNAPAFGTPEHTTRSVPISAASHTSNALPAVPPGITITPIPLTGAAPNANSSNTMMSSTAAEAQRNPTPKASPPKLVPTLRSASNTLSPTAHGPILRRSLVTRSSDESKHTNRSNVLKRKLVSAPIPDAMKRLRPRSPKPISPSAVGSKTTSNTPPLSKKVSTAPKLHVIQPTNPTIQTQLDSRKVIASFSPPKGNINWNSKIRDEDESSNDAESFSNYKSSSAGEAGASKSSVELTTKTSTDLSRRSMFLVQNSTELAAQKKPNAPAEALEEDTTKSNDSLQAKRKPLMGPASKMNAIRANAAAKVNTAQELQTDVSIKQSIANPSALPITKPCSVSITKADELVASYTKANESLNELRRLTSTSTKDDCIKASDMESKTSTQSIATTATKTYLTTTTRSSARRTSDNDPMKNDGTKASVTTTETPNTKVSKQNLILKTDSIGRMILSPPHKPNVSKVNVLSAPKTMEITSPKVGAAASNPKNSKAISTAPKIENFLDYKTPNKPNPSVAKIERPGTRTSIFATPIAKQERPPASASAPKSNSTSPKQAESLSSCSPSMQSQSRILRVVLPTLKSGVFTVPETSPHPNLKISSVISGGTAIAAAALRVDNRATKTQEKSGSHIEKLQQELADLRRTVARLSKKKP